MPKFVTTGFRSQLGEDYVLIESRGVRALVPRAQFGSPKAETKQLLWALNLQVIEDKALNSLLSEVNQISSWEPAVIAGAPGWNGPDIFVCPDGRPVASPDACATETAKCPGERNGSRKGKLMGWQREVAAMLQGQALPLFAVSFAFAPPLLDIVPRNINLGFSVFGPAATGKTTLQQLAASVWGAPSGQSQAPYMLTTHTTTNALEETMRDHSDLPIIMDELALFSSGASAKKRANELRDFVFKLASGQEKARFNAPGNRKRYALGLLLTSNEPFADMLEGGATDEAARHRILDIPNFLERPHHVFDYLPEGFESGGALASALISSAERHYGRAGPKFISGLVAARAANAEKLRKKIENHLAAFRTHVGADMHSGTVVRISEAFGMVYAAGRLAQNYGALPEELDILSAVAACYRLNRLHEAEPLPFRERLQALVDADTTVRWSRKTPNKVAKADAIYYGEREIPELWIRSPTIERVFPDWVKLKHHPEVRKFWCPDKDDHPDRKRQAGKDFKPTRVYVFRLTDL